MKQTVFVIMVILCTWLSGCASQNVRESVLDQQKQMHVALRAEESGQLDSAMRISLQVYQDLIQKQLDIPDEVLLAMGRISYKRQQYRKAYQYLYQVSEVSPVLGEVSLWRARSLLKLGQAEQAGNELKHIASAEQDEAFHLVRAVVYDNLAQHGLAQSIYLDLLKKDPFNYQAKENYGRSLFIQGQYQQAEQVFYQLHRLAPDNQIINRLLAMCRYQQGKAEMAIDALTRFDSLYKAQRWLDETAAQLPPESSL